MAVDLTLEGPQDQRRITVAFRIILAIPHLLFASVLGALALVLIVIGWFAALFTARLPPGIHDVLGRILQYMAKVYGYALLLTDRFPSFRLGADPDDPVVLEIDPPVRHNRAAVLFRAILQIWAWTVLQVVTSGLAAIVFVAWLITLVAGRMPPSAHLAIAAILRYQLRTYAYVGLLTSDYPGGLFGDRHHQPSTPIGTEPELPLSPRITRLVLPRAARNLVILAVALGLVLQVINVAVSFSGFGDLGTAVEIAQRDDRLEERVDTYLGQLQACERTRLPCSEETARMRAELDDLQVDLVSMDLPDRALDEIGQVAAVVGEMHHLLDELAVANDDLERQTLRFRFGDQYLVLSRRMQALYEAVLDR